MEERYTKLFTLPAQTDSSAPVEIVAGALLRDRQSDTVLAQIRYRNRSAKSIRSISVVLAAQDAGGGKISGVVQHTYENLIAAQGACFGDQTPVVLHDSNAHAFSVEVRAVTFSDGTVWNQRSQQVVDTARELGASAVPAAKAAARTTATRIVPFVCNLAVFLLLLSFAASFLFLLPQDHTAEDIICAIGFSIVSVISFPAFGKRLAGRRHGTGLRVLRWVLVLLILFGMSALVRAL